MSLYILAFTDKGDEPNGIIKAKPFDLGLSAIIQEYETVSDAKKAKDEYEPVKRGHRLKVFKLVEVH